MSRWVTSRSAIAVAAMLVLGGAVVAGCGSGGGGGTGSGGGSVSQSELAKYDKEVAGLFRGTSTPPVGGPVKTSPGEDIWVISVGQSVEAAQLTTDGVQAAAKLAGWNVNVYDAKFETSRELTGLQQAVAAGASAIIVEYFDCEPVKAGFEEAAKANIPVVAVESRDCKPSLEHNIKYVGGMNFEEWVHGDGQAAGKWLIAETEGKAKVILTEETDLVTTVETAAGVREEFEKCAGCEILDTIKFTGTSFNSLQGKIEQALTQYPQANAFSSNYDAVVTVGGGAAALRSSGRLPEIKVAGGEGSRAAIELIRNEEGLDACSGASVEWMGYEAATLVARIKAGQDPEKANSGIGWQLCDREHNLPPKGQAFSPSIDYVAEYEKILGAG